MAILDLYFNRQLQLVNHHKVITYIIVVISIVSYLKVMINRI